MFQPNGSTIECDTCVAANTSACGECIVSYILANDAGPIEYVPAPESVNVTSVGIRQVPGSIETGSIDTASVETRSIDTPAIAAAVDLFVRAGMVDEPVVFLSVADFQAGRVLEPVERVLVR